MSQARSLIPFAFLAVVFASCQPGGGGSKGLNLVPALVSVVFLGSTTPAAGDKIRFFFSEDVAAVAGKILDDGDVALSTGTLGTVTAPPAVISARVLEVTLGAGVSFTPGTTTIDFASGNDAVTDKTGLLVKESSVKVISDGDGDDPSISNLTMNGIDDLTNGDGPAGGTLQTPPNGFTIDLTYADTSGAVDPGKTVIVANVQVTASGQTRAAGENLLADLAGTGTANSASYTVPTTLVFPLSTIRLTAFVVDTTGRVSAPVTFDFRVTGFSGAIRPFETVTNASQQWFLDLTRDVESYSVNLGNTSTPVVVSNGASGKPDLDELFATIGLQNPSSPIANVIGTKNSDQVVMDLFRTELSSHLALLLNGINVSFTYTSPGAFPSATGQIDYNAGTFSQMCVAGSQDATGATGILGLAIFDPNNRNQDNDCLTSFGTGGDRLGVFLHTIVNSGYKQSALTLFRVTYDPLTPVRSGTAVGVDSQDKDRLINLDDNTKGLSDGRTTTIGLAINRMARFTAVVVAHECGHSMGLVAGGAMPTGLYGGDSSNFPTSTEGHIVMPVTVFPFGSINVMSPALGFGATQNGATAFNAINKAYLQERALYDLK